MITSSNPLTIGSENCPPVIHKMYGCGSPDFLITEITLDHDTGTLTIYQNPNNCKSVEIAELLTIQEVQKKVSELINSKVDKTYFLHTTNGLDGGGTLQNERILVIKPNDAHIDVSDAGLKIKEFTQVGTSGTVPSPERAKQTDEYFLNALGQWTKLAVLKFKGVLETSTTLTDLDEGDMYIIKDLGNPDAFIMVNGQKFFSTDVIVWDGTKFVDIGQVSVKVNLSLLRGAENNEIKNTAGNGVVLLPAGNGNAGLMTNADKTNLDTLHTRKVVTSVSEATPYELEVKFDVTSTKSGEANTVDTITIPAASTTTAGVMTKSDKTILERLNDEVKVTSVTGAEMSSTEGVINIARTGTNNNQTVNIPQVDSTTGKAGLMTPGDKRRLDQLTDIYIQSNWDTTDSRLASFIVGKPNVLTSSDNTSTRGYLVPNSAGVSGEYYLKWNGEWSEVKSTPPITVSPNEPTEPGTTAEGAIWIIP